MRLQLSLERLFTTVLLTGRTKMAEAVYFPAAGQTKPRTDLCVAQLASTNDGN